jgi:AraC family transcriptional regulator
MQLYDDSFSFTEFNPDKEFEKWAAVEVTSFSNVPKETGNSILYQADCMLFFYTKERQQPGQKHSGLFSENGCPSQYYSLDR